MAGVEGWRTLARRAGLRQQAMSLLPEAAAFLPDWIIG